MYEAESLLVNAHQVSACLLARIIGLLSDSIPAILPAPLATLSQLTKPKESTSLIGRIENLRSLDSGSTNRAEVVVTNTSSSQWKSNQSSATRHDVILRCIHMGMGSKLS